MDTSKVIVIYGGSFNPPHKGHAAAITTILSHIPCDEIWILPSSDRHDKKMSVSGDHRLAMLNLMVSDLEVSQSHTIKVVDTELRRSIPTTTIETKEEIEKIYPQYSFIFVAGSDVIPDITTKWYRGIELAATARFIFLVRPGYKSFDSTLLPHNSTMLENPRLLKMSSTDIRNMVAQKLPFEQGVTPSVAEYIKTNHLYQ